VRVRLLLPLAISMTASILPNAVTHFDDNNGNPLAGGQVFFYIPNTSTLKNTWQDPEQTILNTNPVILDSRGEAIIWGSGTYRQVVKDSDGNLIWDRITEDPNAGLTGNMTDDMFTAGVDFTPGVTTTLTLSIGAGSLGNVWIFFDGVFQGDDQISSLVGLTLTFTAPIPVGVTKVTVKIGNTIAIGIPGAGTVTDASVALNAAIKSSKLSFLQAGTGAVSRTVQSKLREFVSVTDYGAVGDGIIDDTAKIQAAIDANKGGAIIFPAGKIFLSAGIMLNDSTYNNTILIFDGWCKLKPDGGNINFGGSWVGLIIKDCDGVIMNPKWDGNRSAMSDNEHIHCVGFAGARNVYIPDMMVKEIRADGLYIGQKDWLSNSDNSTQIKIGAFNAFNSADDGRNAISIISGTIIDIDTVRSINVGGIVGGFTMPGGVDIEPDHGYQTCANIRIGYADIITAGTSGLGVFGKSISGDDSARDWNCFNILIEDCNILKTGTSGASLSSTPFTRVADLKVKGVLSYNSTRGAGPDHDYSQRIDADWTVTNVTNGVVVGPSNTVIDFSIRAEVSNYTLAGIRVSGCSRGRFTGWIYGAVGGTAFSIQCHDSGRAGLTQEDVAYEVDTPYDGTTLRAFRNEPGNLVSLGKGCIVRNCDWTGYPNQGATNDAAIRTENVLGWTNATAVPTSGTWFFGTFVKNDVPAQASGKIMIGWSRLNTGSNNVLNNDWSQVFATIS